MEHDSSLGKGHQSVLRSNRCLRFVPIHESIQTGPTHKCNLCVAITKQASFRAAMHRLCKNGTTKKNNSDRNRSQLNYTTMKQRLQLERRRSKATRRKLQLLKHKHMLTTMQRPTKKGVLIENANRKDMPAIVKRLRTLRESGDFTGCNTAVAFAEDLLLRLNGRRQGLTYNNETTQIAALIRSTGGCKLYSLISDNLSICHERSVRGKISTSATFLPGVQEQNIVNLVQFYKNAKKKYNVTSDVAYFLASDETACDSRPGWDPLTDTFVMFCGKQCLNKCPTVAQCRKRGTCPEVHQCNWKGFSREPLGSSSEGYTRLKTQFEEDKLTTHARVVMVNPLHSNLPPMPILFMGTCNAFTCDLYIEPQRALLEKWCRSHLDPVLGHCVGWSSDGDSRRRKAAIRASLSPYDGPSQLRLPVEDFTHVALLTTHGAITSITNIQDQDFVHNGKKLINVLCHQSRQMHMGPDSLVHMNQLIFLVSNCGLTTLQHGIKLTDLHRVGYDAMDWPSAERLISPRALSCLRAQIPFNPTFEPMHRYLTLCRRYILLFQSCVVPWTTRISYAAYVVTYLRLWRLWIMNTNGYTLKDNFITRECFTDVKLSCHAFVLVLLTYDKLNIAKPPDMRRMGTDCCEDLFSSLGSWVMNKRIYTILDGLYTLKTQLYVKGLQVQSGFKTNSKNKRLRSSWVDEKVSDPPVDLSKMPSLDDMVSAWKKGKKEAYTHATTDKMKPKSPFPDWWKRPWRHDGDAVNVNSMRNDDDFEQPPASDTDEDVPGNDDDASSDDDDDDDDAQQLADASDSSSLSTIATSQLALMSNQASPIAATQISSTVFVPELQAKVHKLTVIASLFNGKKLSNDRGIRVQQSNQEARPVTTVDWDNKWSIGLYDDVAIRFALDDGSFACYFGRIIRIRCKRSRARGTGWVDYTRPIDIGNDRTKLPNLFVVCYYYQPYEPNPTDKQRKRKQPSTSTNSPPVYTYNLADPQSVHIDCVICPVTFTFDSSANTYSIDKKHYQLCMQSLAGEEFFDNAWANIVSEESQ